MPTLATQQSQQTEACATTLRKWFSAYCTKPVLELPKFLSSNAIPINELL